MSIQKLAPSEVWLSFDDRYLWPALVCIYTGKLNSESQVKWIIAFDHRNLSLKSHQILEDFASYFKVDLDFVELVVDDNYIHSEDMSKFVYTRLILADTLPETFIFMDVDILLLFGWEEIFKLNEIPHGIILSAALEEKDIETKNQAVLISGEAYFNAGIMRINPVEWRSQNLNLRYKELLSEYSIRNFEFEDQDILNFLCFDRFEILSSEYNFAPNTKQHILQTKAKIIHFKGLDKPWKVPSLQRPHFINEKKWYPQGYFPLYWETEKNLLKEAYSLSKEFRKELKKIQAKARDKNDLSLKRLLRILKQFTPKN